MRSWFRTATRRRLLRVAATLVLTSVCLASPAAQAATRSTLRLVSAALSPAHLLHVRGTVGHAPRGVRVRLEFRAVKAPKGSWKWLGRSEPLGANGAFTISVTVPDGDSTLAIRAVLVRGKVVLMVGRAESVSMSAISVLGSKTTQPATNTTLATTSPGTTTPSPTCPTGQLGTPPKCQPPPSPDKGTTLTPGETLSEGDYLESNGGQYKLIMQGDGNLVLYQEGKALWSSETGGNPGSYAIMESEGNFVVYDGTVAKWNSSTWGFPGAYLSLQEEGNLVIDQDGHPLWDWGSGYLANELNQWKLEPGAYLLSPNHEYELVMQSSDGNLVLYHDGTALWSSQTGGNPGSYAVMQSDGNFVVYGGGTAEWNSSTWGFPGDYLVLQNEGNLVIYQDGHPVWDWGSGYLGDELNQWKLEPGAYLLSPNHEYELIMQASDGNLVLYHDGTSLWSSQTGGEPGSYAVMQSDGNFVIYKPHGAPWSTGTSGHPGAFLGCRMTTTSSSTKEAQRCGIGEAGFWAAGADRLQQRQPQSTGRLGRSVAQVITTCVLPSSSVPTRTGPDSTSSRLPITEHSTPKPIPSRFGTTASIPGQRVAAARLPHTELWCSSTILLTTSSAM